MPERMENQGKLEMAPVDLGHNVWMIDLLEQGQPCRSAAYLILDEKITLIETGSSVSHDLLIRSLAQLNVQPHDLAYVIVTHVHLDHAGGAGPMMEKAINAKLVVHPRGARHMIDPSKLWAGATQVYGNQIADLFGFVSPVDESQVLIRNHLDTLTLGERTLTFYDSPGHAKHHFTIHDPINNAVYAGDALGIRYRSCFTGWDFEWVMPSTSPIDFDPVAVHRTAAMLQEVPFDWVYHTHFGKSPKQEAIAQTERCADAMAELIHRVYKPGITVETVVEAFRTWIVSDLTQQGYTPGTNVDVLDIDVILDALGLMYYEEKNRTTP